MDIALAAVKLAHQPSGRDAEKEDEPSRPPVPAVRENITGDPVAAHGMTVPMARIYVGAGRVQNVLPQNLAGAITSGGIKGNLIGSIEICDKYSLVEVPEALLDDVVRAMQNTLIKGKRPVVRRFVEKAIGKKGVRR